MLKNITLSADEELIAKARDKARRERTTLNDRFREWLKRYVTADECLTDFEALMESLSYADSGKPSTRHEINER